MSSVQLTKPAVATRLVRAAIRSFFREDDELATYLLAATAHRLLHDVLEKRDSNPTSSDAAKGALWFAKQVADGGKYTGPEDGEDFVMRLVPFVRSGQVTTWEEAQEFFSDESIREAMRIIRAPYNFMKHADRDLHSAMSESRFSAEEELLSACTLFEDAYPDADVPELGLIFYSVQRQNGKGYSPDVEPLAVRLDSIPDEDLNAKICDLLSFIDRRTSEKLDV